MGTMTNLWPLLVVLSTLGSDTTIGSQLAMADDPFSPPAPQPDGDFEPPDPAIIRKEDVESNVEEDDFSSTEPKTAKPEKQSRVAVSNIPPQRVGYTLWKKTYRNSCGQEIVQYYYVANHTTARVCPPRNTYRKVCRRGLFRWSGRRCRF